MRVQLHIGELLVHHDLRLSLVFGFEFFKFFTGIVCISR